MPSHLLTIHLEAEVVYECHQSDLSDVSPQEVLVHTVVPKPFEAMVKTLALDQFYDEARKGKVQSHAD